MRVADKKVGTRLAVLDLREALIEVYRDEPLDYLDGSSESVRVGALEYWTTLILSPNAVKETRNFLSAFTLSIQQNYDDSLPKAASLFWQFYNSCQENDYVKHRTFILLLTDIARRYEITARELARYLLSTLERSEEQREKLVMEFMSDQVIWAGKPLNLEPLPTRVLKMLAENPMELITSEAISAQHSVHSESLKTTISKIRKEIGNELLVTEMNGRKTNGYKLLLPKEQIMFDTLSSAKSIGNGSLS